MCQQLGCLLDLRRGLLRHQVGVDAPRDLLNTEPRTYKRPFHAAGLACPRAQESSQAAKLRAIDRLRVILVDDVLFSERYGTGHAWTLRDIGRRSQMSLIEGADHQQEVS
jgi:pyrimidine operon attenuation protein/uracil phosphoribosyltransferase